MRASIVEAYHNRISSYKEQLSQTQGKFLTVSYARLIVFLLGAVAAYFLFGIDPLYGILAGVAGFLGFMYLVKIHTDIVGQREHLKRLIRVCEQEVEGLGGDLSSFDMGEDFIDPQHAFSFDLDIFGKNSIFQLLNRTGTVLGKRRLIHWLEFPEQEVSAILNRQEAVKDLAESIEWNLNFEATALGETESYDDTTTIKWWVKEPAHFSINPLYKILVWLLPVLFYSSLLAWMTNYMLFLRPLLGDFQFPLAVPIILFFVQLGVGGINLSRTNAQHRHVGQKSRLLRKYGTLLSLIEKKETPSVLLKNYQEELKSDKQTASEALEELADISGLFDQRMNILMGLILNGTLLWDIRQMMKLERWRESHAEDVPVWFEQVTSWDALNSLGRFAYNHQEYIYPEVVEGDFSLFATELGHPLIDPEVRVDNDISFRKPGEFIITTGANMAGKSTFLRTVGVNLILGMMGLPVCANTYRFSPIGIMTSVRITDSISENESFFYAELKRLKMIIDQLRSGGKPIFIIVDEMLRGTNSRDKMKGSRGYIEQLIQLKGVGMIATHDLSLGTLADEYPEYAFNKRFEISIEGEKLSFDYKFIDGISQNLNATFLMEQMGILPKER
ncbi:MAG: hypothetical protein AAFY71_13800 [Bacteroidota bacterium]